MTVTMTKLQPRNAHEHSLVSVALVLDQNSAGAHTDRL